MTAAQLIAQLRRDRAQLERTLVALAVVAVSLFLGVVARRRAAPIQQQLTEIRNAVERADAFRAAYRPLSDSGEQRLILAADSVDVAVPASSRLVVAQGVANDAEHAGLRDVRVRFGGTDSLFIPKRGAGAEAPAPASYTIIVEGRGDFTQLLALLDRLPSGVTVAHLSAAADKLDTRFHVTLAVYEVANAKQSG